MSGSGERDRWGELLGALAARSAARPVVTLVLALAIVAVALALTVTRLGLKTSNLDLIDPRLPPVAAFRDFAARFGTPNMLVVALEGGDPEVLGEAADRIAAAVRRRDDVRAALSRLPFPDATLEALGLEPHLMTDDRGMAFVFVQPADAESRAEKIAPFVAGVRAEIAAEALDAAGIHAGFTGLPQYALDDRDIIQRDLSRLSLLSLVLVVALFVAGFHEWLWPLAATGALLAAMAATLGVAAFVPGHLTLVSAFFFSTLFGQGIDYGIHVVDRTEELQLLGWQLPGAVAEGVRRLGRGLATGALTTALALFTLTVSGFRGFAELGWMAGLGILLSLVAAVTLLPALLALLPRRTSGDRGARERLFGAVLVRCQRPGGTLLLLGAALVGIVLPWPRFDGDYLDLQPVGSEAVRLEREMVKRSALSPQFAAFVAADRNAARALVNELRASPLVGQVRSELDLERLQALAGGSESAELRDLEKSFVDSAGRFAVYAYPAGDIWEPEFRDAFLAEMRRLDPGVTGMPVLGEFMIGRSQRALAITGVLAALLALAMAAADFRSVRWTLLALAPTALTMTGLLGGMRLLGLDLNPLNILALPIVVGVSVDNGVHLTHRFRSEAGDLGRTLSGTGRTLLINALNTLAGFGPLAFTAHRGLASFAGVLSLGVVWSMLLSVFALPLLLSWLGGRELAR